MSLCLRLVQTMEVNQSIKAQGGQPTPIPWQLPIPCFAPSCPLSTLEYLQSLGGNLLPSTLTTPPTGTKVQHLPTLGACTYLLLAAVMCFMAHWKLENDTSTLGRLWPVSHCWLKSGRWTGQELVRACQVPGAVTLWNYFWILSGGGNTCC